MYTRPFVNNSEWISQVTALKEKQLLFDNYITWNGITVSHILNEISQRETALLWVRFWVDLSQFFPLPSENTILNQWWFGGGGGSSTAKKLISGTTIFFGDIVLTYLESINIFMLKNYLQFFGLTMFTTPIVISVLACYWAGRNNWALIGQERYTCRLAKYSASLAKYGQQNFRSAVEKLIF